MSDKNKFLKIGLELGAKIPELDLHGQSIGNVEETVDQFLYRCFLDKEIAGRIITGGGTGKLKEKVTHYLAKNNLVEEVVDEFGSLVAVLSKNS